jgi:hypothetical protein
MLFFAVVCVCHIFELPDSFFVIAQKVVVSFPALEGEVDGGQVGVEASDAAFLALFVFVVFGPGDEVVFQPVLAEEQQDNDAIPYFGFVFCDFVSHMFCFFHNPMGQSKIVNQDLAAQKQPQSG